MQLATVLICSPTISESKYYGKNIIDSGINGPSGLVYGNAAQVNSNAPHTLHLINENVT
jgi:hypothetical protein